MPPALQNVGFEPQLNAQCRSTFPSATNPAAASSCANISARKPVVLSFVYYGCPMLCNQVQQGVVGTLRMLSFNPGVDYQVVFISF